MKEDDFIEKYEKIFCEYPDNVDYDLFYEYDVMSYKAISKERYESFAYNLILHV